MPISEQARRIRAYADQQWLAKQQREYQKWVEARTFFPSTIRDREVAAAGPKPEGLIADATRGSCSPLGGVAKQGRRS